MSPERFEAMGVDVLVGGATAAELEEVGLLFEKLDRNCVVKGLAVDAAAQRLDGDGFVAAGGDVAVRGAAVVGLPGGGSLTLRDGGLATSGTTRRRWLRGGDTQHHLIDPRTGRP